MKSGPSGEAANRIKAKGTPRPIAASQIGKREGAAVAGIDGAEFSAPVIRPVWNTARPVCSYWHSWPQCGARGQGGNRIPKAAFETELRTPAPCSVRDNVDQIEPFLPRRVGETVVEGDDFERRGTAFGGEE